MKSEYKKELEELGWKFYDYASMNDYYVFERQQERICIDTDKAKIEHYMFDINALPELSYETLKVVMKIFKDKVGD